MTLFFVSSKENENSLKTRKKWESYPRNLFSTDFLEWYFWEKIAYYWKIKTHVNLYECQKTYFIYLLYCAKKRLGFILLLIIIFNRGIIFNTNSLAFFTKKIEFCNSFRVKLWTKFILILKPIFLEFFRRNISSIFSFLFDIKMFCDKNIRVKNVFAFWNDFFEFLPQFTWILLLVFIYFSEKD